MPISCQGQAAVWECFFLHSLLSLDFNRSLSVREGAQNRSLSVREGAQARGRSRPPTLLLSLPHSPSLLLALARSPSRPHARTLSLLLSLSCARSRSRSLFLSLYIDQYIDRFIRARPRVFRVAEGGQRGLTVNPLTIFGFNVFFLNAKF